MTDNKQIKVSKAQEEKINEFGDSLYNKQLKYDLHFHAAVKGVDEKHSCGLAPIDSLGEMHESEPALCVKAVQTIPYKDFAHFVNAFNKKKNFSKWTVISGNELPLDQMSKMLKKVFAKKNNAAVLEMDASRLEDKGKDQIIEMLYDIFPETNQNWFGQKFFQLNIVMDKPGGSLSDIHYFAQFVKQMSAKEELKSNINLVSVLSSKPKSWLIKNIKPDTTWVIEKGFYINGTEVHIDERDQKSDKDLAAIVPEPNKPTMRPLALNIYPGGLAGFARECAVPYKNKLGLYKSVNSLLSDAKRALYLAVTDQIVNKK